MTPPHGRMAEMTTGRASVGHRQTSSPTDLTTKFTVKAGMWHKPDYVTAKVTQGRQGSPLAVALIMTIIQMLISRARTTGDTKAFEMTAFFSTRRPALADAYLHVRVLSTRRPALADAYLYVRTDRSHACAS